MARLYEYQGKKLLAQSGIRIPRAEVVRLAEEAGAVAGRINKSVVIKAQVHGTNRAATGGIVFAETSREAVAAARKIFEINISSSAVESFLVEEKLEIEREFYVGFIVDDRLKRPTLLLNQAGGSGVEERAAEMKSFVCSVRNEPSINELLNFVREADVPQVWENDLAEVLLNLYRTAKSCEARVAEINPLAVTKSGEMVALDCRISVDDYAVFRHPELEVEIARELGHAATELEKIAWAVEKDDYRGTFYFVEILNRGETDGVLIGFHGAGGGGSMASLDAAQRNGLQPACYVDTSGNPPASKVYRAAKIILSIPNIRGYFLSGSGVASQEQFQIARAVIKAFLEVQPEIPAVLRLGGNGEEIAAKIVEKYAGFLPAPVEAYQKVHSADFCAARLRELIVNAETQGSGENPKSEIQSPKSDNWYNFKTRTGRVFYDHAALAGQDTTAMIESCPTKILSKNESGLPVLNISEEEAERGKCVECLACEFAAWEILGIGKGAKIDFLIADLNGDFN